MSQAEHQETSENSATPEIDFSDFSEVLEAHKAQISEQSNTIKDLSERFGKTNQTLERFTKAMRGDEEAPKNEYEKNLRDHAQTKSEIQAIMEKMGKGSVPITEKLSSELSALIERSEKRAENWEKKYAELAEKVERHDNPDFELSKRAMTTIEGMLKDSIGQLYPGDAEARVRGTQWNATVNAIDQDIREIMEEDRKNKTNVWDDVRRSPTKMRNLVNHHMHQNLPPKVREMLAQQKIDSEPMSQQENWEAFREAKNNWEAAIRDGDTKAEHFWSGLMDEARQDIHGGQRSDMKAGRRTSLNSLIGQKRA